MSDTKKTDDKKADAAPDQPGKDLPKNIPVVDEPSTPPGGKTPTPPLDKFTDGTYKRKSDGEEYALAIVDPNPLNGRTHCATNNIHYWEGTEKQFLDAFTETDGSPIAPKKGDKKAADDKKAAKK